MTHQIARRPDSPTLERKNMETVTILPDQKRDLRCADLVEEKWTERQEDLKDPEFEGLGFDYVEPHTFNDQWRDIGVGSSAGAGPATSCAHS